MSEFKKVECTCSSGYTCRNMQDPNCCAHSCDYNDLVDAFNALQAERDSLAAQVVIMRSTLEKARPHVRTCYKQGYAEWSDFEAVTSALEFLPQHHLAAHDAEVAAKAVLEFSEHLVGIGHLRSAYPAEEYVANLRTKAQL